MPILIARAVTRIGSAMVSVFTGPVSVKITAAMLAFEAVLVVNVGVSCDNNGLIPAELDDASVFMSVVVMPVVYMQCGKSVKKHTYTHYADQKLI